MEFICLFCFITYDNCISSVLILSYCYTQRNDNKNKMKKEQNLTIPVTMNWVSVEDALPTIEKNVLIWDGFNIYITNRLDSKYVVWDESIQILDDVTHWMYLPEPPLT